MQITRYSLVALATGMMFFGGCSDDGGGSDGGVTPDTRVQVELSHEDLLDACVRLAACNIERKPRLEDCVENFHKRYTYFGQQDLYEALYACANQHNGDCAAIRTCLGYATRPKEGDCDKTYQASCDGDVAKTCDLIVGGWEQALDCSKGGLKCAMRDTGSGMTALCTVDSCNTDLFKPECRDNKLLTCVGGAVQIDDCAAKQLQCRDADVGLCEGTGTSCPGGQIAPSCNGNVLVSCEQNYLAEIDCSKNYGQKTCDPNTVSCKGIGTECDVGGIATFDECDGDKLVACVDGFKKTFDCKAMGFLGCKKAATYGAYCDAEPVYE